MEIKDNEFAAIVAELNAEPLTHLMLGHRELFHSNLLAWFFESFPEISDQVFQPLACEGSFPGTSRKVRREYSNLDMLFEWPDRCPLVIENKVFSLPDESQLKDYGTKIEVASFWLLSLGDPKWRNNQKHKWRWLSFYDLAERICTALPSNDRSYPIETMRHYVHVIRLLFAIAKKVAVTNLIETVALPDNIKGALGGKRFASSMAKIRALSVAQHLNEALYLNEALRGGKIVCPNITIAFSKGSPIIEWSFVLNSASGLSAGWQLQNDQFRIKIDYPGKNIEGCIVWAKEHEEIFDFSSIDPFLKSVDIHPWPQKKDFNIFKPSFVYRYKRVPHLTVSQLADAANAVASRMITYLTLLPDCE